MSFNKVMANMLAGSNTKIIHEKFIGSTDSYSEWLKWLAYIPDFQKSRMQELESKTVKELTLEEIDEVRAYRSQNRMLELFKIYGTDKITKDEYTEVYDFMINRSIEELMLSKLSSQELKYAKEQISYLSQIPSEELRKKINSAQAEDNYEKLSMVDSYILHIISKINYARSIAKLDSEIKARLAANDDIRQRSLYYASNPYINK